MNSLSFEQLYGAMIAGAVPAHGGDIEQSASYAAVDALNTTSVHYFFAHEKGAPKAYYFAVPSKALASHASARIPLTAAIPGEPGHQGEGAYVTSSNGLSAVAILQDGELGLMMNSEDIIQRHLQETGITVYLVHELEGGALTSSRSRGRGAAEKLSALVSKFSVFALGLGIAGTFGFSIANGYLEGKVEDAYLERSQALAKVSQEMNFSSPLSQQVSRIHTLAAVALKNGGYIEKFAYKGGVTTYALAVSKDAEALATKALGAGLEATSHDTMVELAFDDSKPIVRSAAGKGTIAKSSAASVPMAAASTATRAAAASPAPSAPTDQKVAAK